MTALIILRSIYSVRQEMLPMVNQFAYSSDFRYFMADVCGLASLDYLCIIELYYATARGSKRLENRPFENHII